jgi:hypothetical protein
MYYKTLTSSLGLAKGLLVLTALCLIAVAFRKDLVGNTLDNLFSDVSQDLHLHSVISLFSACARRLVPMLTYAEKQ